MGFGDEIMAAGHAEHHSRASGGGAVAVRDRFGRPRWSEVWAGNPYIAEPGAPSALHVVNGPGARPYCTFEGSVCAFTAWRARDYRGHLWLTPAETEFGAGATRPGYVVIEPNLKSTGNPNKQWPRDRYAEVVKRLEDFGLRAVQLGDARTRLVPGADLVVTPTYRLACAVLAHAHAYIGAEGGLHHAAAALEVPAVVIFGGALSAENTGYPEHTNLGGDGPCGQWVPCTHCEQAMQAISVDDVIKGLECQLSS